MLTEDTPHRVGDLAQRRTRFDRGDNRRNQIGRPARGRNNSVEGNAPFTLASARAHRTNPIHLPALDVGIDAEDVR